MHSVLIFVLLLLCMTSRNELCFHVTFLQSGLTPFRIVKIGLYFKISNWILRDSNQGLTHDMQDGIIMPAI